MRAYFVRKADDHTVVGVFFASSTILLATLVDEYWDPAGCEYIVARAGGLIVPAATRTRWPLPISGKETTGLRNAVFTQQWADDLALPTSRFDWKSLKPAAEQVLRSFRRAAERATKKRST